MKKFSLLFLGYIFIVFLFNHLFAQNYFPKSDQINQVLQDLRGDYVDADRLNPEKMLRASLEQLARDIPSVVLKDVQGEPLNGFTLQVNKKVQKFSVSRIKTLNDLSNILQTIIIYIKENLVEEKNFKEIDYTAITGLLSVLDPYTSLLVPKVYTEFQEDIGGNYSGVGMYIGIREEKLQVVSPIFNSPAYRAGLQGKDNILQIDGESTINMSVATASSKIKGPVGTKVKLLIERKSFEEPKIFEITRASIALKSAKGLELKTKAGRVGYILISRFHEKTASEVAEVLEKLRMSLSDFQGIVLDLRNNPGGILQQAAKVSNKFLKKGVIVTTAGINNKERHVYKARSINTAPNIPIIVLMNGNSASAAEILAAALKQNHRALVIGTQSFGKGSVQQLRKYRDGSALKLTIAKYLTPNKNSLHSVGIFPHIEVNPWFIDDKNISIISRKKLFPEKEDKFADWANAPVQKPRYSFNYLLDSNFKQELFTTSEVKADIAGFDIENLKKNYLLYLAVSILENNSTANFEQLLASAIKTVEKKEQTQNIKLQNKLEEIGISWRAKKYIPKNLKINFWGQPKEENSCSNPQEHELKAGSEITLCLELVNSSDKETIRLQAFSTSEHPLFDKKQFVFGNIPPKKSKKWYVSVRIPEDFPTAEVPLTINVLNAKEEEILAKKFFFRVTEIPQPKFQYTISASSKNGQIIAPHTVDLKVEIHNQTAVASGKLGINLKNGEGKRIFLTSGKDSIEKLTSKKSQILDFGFELRNPIPDNVIDLSLSFTDSKYKKNISHNFSIPYGVKTYTIENSAPTIAIKKYPFVTKNSKITLQVSSKDNEKIKDIYIFSNDKKEFYQSFSQKDVLQNIPILLKQGLNEISIFSRDNYNITTQKTIFIYKN